MSDKNIFISIILIFVIFLIGLFHFYPPAKEEKLQIEENSLANMEIETLQTEILQEGEGEGAKNGDTITVHYTGALEDGTKFDSSLDRGKPFTFTLGVGDVIIGWDQGIIGMKEGEKRKLTIPPSFGYGENAVGSIPANSTLIFEVELIEIN